MDYASSGLCVRAFTKHVTLVMYGDDNILNVSDDKIDKFNQHTMMHNFPKFGLIYTSDDKEDKNPKRFRSIKEVTFLKRSFVHNDVACRTVAALDKETIYNMLHYTKKGASQDTITRDNCYMAMREMSLHGQKDYDKFERALIDACAKRKFEGVIPYGYQDNVFQALGLKPEYML